MARHGTGATVQTRLYIEGYLIENAFVHATVTGATGTSAVAQIDLVPTNTIKHVLPGTWVHIFTTDPWEMNPKGDLSDFKLLFEGVVTARGFSRTEGTRSVSIQCSDPSVYWAEARQFWLNLASANGNIVDQLVIADSGGYARLGTVNATGSYGYMNARLGQAKDQAEERFMDTMIAAIDDIGSVNPFYTNSRNRFRLTDRIIRGPAGKTSKLFELAMFSDFLEGLAGRAGGQTSLAEMINQLLSAIMHEWVSVPAPPYLKTRTFMRDVFGNIKRNKKTVKREVQGEVQVDLFDYETATDEIIGGIIFKPHIYTLPPPSCNVLFPNMYDNLGFQESFIQEPTRLQMQPQLPMIDDQISQMMKLIRPVELEVFQALVRDPTHQAIKKRSPDARFADGAGQTPTFSDYDWATNEERIRGIVYNFINLAPAPSTLTMTDPGKRTPTGARVGGVPRYLQNVASYEYYKSKYVSRQVSLAGPYNMRPVPGFPILALDDSAASMNMVAYLDGISHSVHASGTAVTTYAISHPRLTDEVDLNRPKFKGTPLGAEIDFDLLRNGNGEYEFGTAFDGTNHPPIPEWFDDSYQTNEGINLRYKEWFGPAAGVAQRVLFKEPTVRETTDIRVQNEARTAALEDKSTFDYTATEADLPPGLRDRIVASNDKISLDETAKEFNRLYRIARDTGDESDVSSFWTQRSFTTIDQAFRFVGAAPLELSDLSEPSDGAIGSPRLTRTGRFTARPAAGRQINYKTAKLDRFVGDTSIGSGFSGVPEYRLPVVKGVGADVAATLTAVGVTSTQAANRMSGAFPVFDTKIHVGDEATDQAIRDALLLNASEREPSAYARYNGRPLMFDFEFRLWQESLLVAKYGLTAEKIAESAAPADYVQAEAGSVRRSTPDEVAAAASKRLIDAAVARKEEADRPKKGRARPGKDVNMSPAVQAPTGDGLDQGERHPLPQPLSEKQVVDLRRAVAAAYQEELASTRGFTG